MTSTFYGGFKAVKGMNLLCDRSTNTNNNVYEQSVNNIRVRLTTPGDFKIDGIEVKKHMMIFVSTKVINPFFAGVYKMTQMVNDGEYALLEPITHFESMSIGSVLFILINQGVLFGNSTWLYGITATGNNRNAYLIQVKSDTLDVSAKKKDLGVSQPTGTIPVYTGSGNTITTSNIVLDEIVSSNKIIKYIVPITDDSWTTVPALVKKANLTVNIYADNLPGVEFKIGKSTEGISVLEPATTTIFTLPHVFEIRWLSNVDIEIRLTNIAYIGTYDVTVIRSD